MTTIAETFIAAFTAFGFTWLVAYTWSLLQVSANRYYEEADKATALQKRVTELTQVAKRDTWLLDAVYYLVRRKWPEPGDRLFEECQPHEGSAEYRKRQKQTSLFKEVSLLITKVQQAAVDEDLVIWGIPKARFEMNINLEVHNDALFDKITLEHWRQRYRIDPEQLIYFPPESIFTSKSDTPNSLDEGSYCSPMVSRRQIQALSKEWLQELEAIRLAASRLRLADLRNEGVQIRINAMQLASVEEVPAWVSEASDWNQRVIEAIAEIDEADSKQFATLDFPGTPRAHLPSYLSDEHQLIYVCHDRRQVRLEEYMTQYSKR